MQWNEGVRWSDLLMLLSLKRHKYYWQEAWATELKTSEALGRMLLFHQGISCSRSLPELERTQTSVQVHPKAEALPAARPSSQSWGRGWARGLAILVVHTLLLTELHPHQDSSAPCFKLSGLAKKHCFARRKGRRWSWARWRMPDRCENHTHSV